MTFCPFCGENPPRVANIESPDLVKLYRCYNCNKIFSVERHLVKTWKAVMKESREK